MDEINIQSRFGVAVKTRRKDLGYSQEELAERAGLHRTYVADVERGARNLSLLSIEKLALALELPIPALFATATSTTGKRPWEGVVDILLVEDDSNDIELTLDAFESANLTNHIEVVRDGAEALDYVFCTGKYLDRKPGPRPQVILLDLYLPKVSGLEVLRRIKSYKQTRTIPVAVLTASERDNDLTESMRLGAEAYIVKPVDLTRLAGVTTQMKLAWTLLRPPVNGVIAATPGTPATPAAARQRTH